MLKFEDSLLLSFYYWSIFDLTVEPLIAMLMWLGKKLELE